MKRVMVLGSSFVDLMTRAPHLPEHGETVMGTYFKMGPGGKGFNQAVAARRAGAAICTAIKLGRDEFASVPLRYMEQYDMNRDYVRYSDELPTGNALIMVDEVTSQNMIAVYAGASASFGEEDFEALKPAIDSCDCLLLQLEINMDFLETVVPYAVSKGIKVILNPAPAAEIPGGRLSSLYAVIPNEVEAKLITGIPVVWKEQTDEELMEACGKAADWFFAKGVSNVIITLGKKGLYVNNGSEARRFTNYDEIKPVDTTGAGDAFCGGFLAALGEEKDIFDAAAFGNVVSNLSVTRIGAAPSMPSREEIDAFLKNR